MLPWQLPTLAPPDDDRALPIWSDGDAAVQYYQRVCAALEGAVMVPAEAQRRREGFVAAMKGYKDGCVRACVRAHLVTASAVAA